ncbi:hypothetical protein GCM10017711_35620 [Paeniglutamicibacter sulfureus]
MGAHGALGQAQVLGEFLDLVLPGAQVRQDHQPSGVGQSMEKGRCCCMAFKGVLAFVVRSI